MTAADFIAKWRANPLTERAGAQTYFNDLCERMEAKMDTRFAEQKAETIKWMVGLAIAQMALLIGILLKLP